MFETLTLQGFKSIRRQVVGMRPMNVLIGANGAGKSNLMDFFRLLDAAMAGRLGECTRAAGGPHALLFEGPEVTPELGAELVFGVEAATACYTMRLSPGEARTLGYRSESMTVTPRDGSAPPVRRVADSFHDETFLRDQELSQTAPPIAAAYDRLSRCRVFQFHDTSAASPLRTGRVPGGEGGGSFHFVRPGRLASDGGNLAEVLFYLRTEQEVYYQRIIATLRLIVPFFDDFVFDPALPAQGPQGLRWKGTDSGYVLGPHQLSDGTLRAMALVTLLLQPEEDLPALIILDEPELGLHPYTVNVLAGLLRSAATRSQLLLSTQSVEFLEHFAPEDVLVVDRHGPESVFHRLDPQRLEQWLEHYSLGELWEKNVLGGRPA